MKLRIATTTTTSARSRSRSSSLSSSISFHTVPISISPMSITDDAAPVAEVQSPQKSPYRRAARITDEIREHCHIYFDEELYVSALALLTDLVISGASHPQCAEKPVFAPLPRHIELVSTLLIHPRHTNHAPPSESLDLASRSITLLRNILAILGPVNAGLDQAFSLTLDNSSRTSRWSRNTVKLDDASSGSDTDDRLKAIRGIVANRGRIRRCARDFWHMVGWAFNCSVKYPRRWKYWKVWLDYMLDVLDADWVERERQDREDELPNRAEDSDEEYEYTMLRQSLLVSYLSEIAGRSSPMKRVVRSAFADGNPESLAEFPEVFPNETKEVKHQNGQKRKRDDPLNRKFGDYDDEEAEFDSSELIDQSPEPSQDTDEDDMSSGDSWLGGTESIILRQRVITLLSRVADALPDCFADCKPVYEEIQTCTKQLPLPAFSLFISPSSSSSLPLVVFISLTQLLLLRYLPASAPRPQTVSGRSDDELSQDVLEKCFLPYPASGSTIAENAKVSIIVESLLRFMSRMGACEYSPSLEAAAEKGIRARENKIKADKRKRENDVKKGEEGDLFWLKASAQRLRCQIAWMQQNG